DHLPSLDRRRPRDALRAGPGAPQEGAEHHRLIEVVYHYCVMRSRAPEVRSECRKAEVIVGARIDEDVRSEGPKGEAQAIRVAVGRDRLEATLAAVEN